jgi:hypothetical protein
MDSHIGYTQNDCPSNFTDSREGTLKAIINYDIGSHPVFIRNPS